MHTRCKPALSSQISYTCHKLLTIMHKPLLFLIAALFLFQSCRKNDGGTQPKLSADTGLDILWDNKPDNNSGDLRLMIYKTETDFNTPFARPFIDTVFDDNNYHTWRVTYQKFNPGTYWIKLFSVNEPDVYLYSNRNVSAKVEVVKDKMNFVGLHAVVDSPKNFTVHQITINQLNSFSNGEESWDFSITAYSDYNQQYLGLDPVVYKTSVKTAQLPATISGLNISLKTLGADYVNPAYYLEMFGPNTGTLQSRLLFWQSLVNARVFDDKVYVWNSNNELAFILQGEWGK